MKLTSKHYLIIVLVLVTAAIHLGAAFALFPAGHPDPLFSLNAIGFVGLLAAYFLPVPFFQRRRNFVRWALIAYNMITVIAWLVIFVGQEVLQEHMPFFSEDSAFGLPSQIIEVVIVYLLWQEKL